MMLDQLRAFLAVAKHLNHRRACDELNLTASANSKRLKALQDELGAQLYRPTRQGIELTDAGRVALAKVAAIVKQADELKNVLRPASRRELQPVVVSVAGAFSLGAELLPELSALFETLHDGVQVNCHTGRSDQIQQMIREGRAGIGLSTYPPLAADIVAEPFKVQILVFFVGHRHPLATRRRVTLSDVLACPLVIRAMTGGASWTHNILKKLSDRGFKYKIALECHGPMEVKEAVAKNIGVGISYLENLKADVASGRFVVLKGGDFHISTLSYIVHSKKHGLSHAAHEFLRLLRRAKKIPQGKGREAITAATKKRGLKPVGNSRKRVYLIPLIVSPVLGLLA